MTRTGRGAHGSIGWTEVCIYLSPRASRAARYALVSRLLLEARLSEPLLLAPLAPRSFPRRTSHKSSAHQNRGCSGALRARRGSSARIRQPLLPIRHLSPAPRSPCCPSTSFCCALRSFSGLIWSASISLGPSSSSSAGSATSPTCARSMSAAASISSAVASASLLRFPRPAGAGLRLRPALMRLDDAPAQRAVTPRRPAPWCRRT